MNDIFVTFDIVGGASSSVVDLAKGAALSSVRRQITEAGENPDDYVTTLLKLPVIDMRERYELRAAKRPSEV